MSRIGKKAVPIPGHSMPLAVLETQIRRWVDAQAAAAPVH
jgi:hypothetical protein